MRLAGAWIGAGGKAIATPKGRRYQVRWRIDPGAGRPLRERKRSGFHTKGEAQAFIERLRHADLGIDGWTFDDAGDPIQARLTAPTFEHTVRLYMESKWHTDWTAMTKSRVVGRFLDLVALTVDSPADAAALRAALGAQAINRGPRPIPATTIEWAARYLRDHYEPTAPPVSCPDVVRGRRWLEANSKPVEVDLATIAALRSAMVDGLAPASARTYWQQTIVPYLNWLYDRDLVERPLTRGLTTMRRDVEGEEVDPHLLPSPGQVSALAECLGQRHGPLWRIHTLLLAWAALRLSESFALHTGSFHKRNGRWWLRVDSQCHRVVTRHSSTGTSVERKTTKSTRHRNPRPRTVPLPSFVGELLEAEYGTRLGSGSEPLFRGPRGALAPEETVRRWWNAALPDVFADHPHLRSVTPHTLRHCGVTFWFAADVDHARIQRWGGWTTITQLLDTYRGVLEFLEEDDLDGLELFADEYRMHGR